jgi:hypothetical protein
MAVAQDNTLGHPLALVALVPEEHTDQVMHVYHVWRAATVHMLRLCNTAKQVHTQEQAQLPVHVAQRALSLRLRAQQLLAHANPAKEVLILPSKALPIVHSVSQALSLRL